MFYVLVIIAFVGPNWWLFSVVGCALTYFKSLSWLGHCSGVSHTLPTEESTLLDFAAQVQKSDVAWPSSYTVAHRMLMSCVQLSFTKESLSFLEMKPCCLGGSPSEVDKLGMEALCYKQNWSYLFWKCRLQNSSEIRS